MSKLDGSEKRKLAAVAIPKLKPENKIKTYSDGYGLRLQVHPNGSKYWRFQYRFAGKAKTLPLGVFPSVSLSEARQAHREAYNKVANGIDPAQERKIERLTTIQAYNDTFEAIAQEWLGIHMADKSKSHIERSERLLMKYLCPHIGKLPISAITVQELLSTLRKIETQGTLDTAHRARGIAKQVYAYAIATGRAERNIPADLQGTLTPHKKKHRAAITDPKLLGKLLYDLDFSRSTLVVKTALKISPILFQRPGEIRHMEWSEIDFDTALWSIPADKMKMRQDHIVPLPKQAIKLLKDLHPYTASSPYVFPSVRGKSRCLSENGVRTALRDLGYDNETVTPHGFRATARTLLDEVLEFRVDLIEAQLAHTVRDANGRAYNRTKFLPQRKEMMQAWADYLDELKEAARIRIEKQ